jgi:DNA polymerase IV
MQLELPLRLADEDCRPGAKKGAARWLADRAVDMIRDRFGWEAVGYASVVLELSHSIPDDFRELAEGAVTIIGRAGYELRMIR